MDSTDWLTRGAQALMRKNSNTRMGGIIFHIPNGLQMKIFEEKNLEALVLGCVAFVVICFKT